MNKSKEYFIVTYQFETTNPPEDVFQGLSIEQTTTGYNTLKKQKYGLSPYIANIESLSSKKHVNNLYVGEVQVAFPTCNLSSTGNPIEDAFCFAIGESRHVQGIHMLRMIDIKFPSDVEHRFMGPRFGVKGIREIIDIWSRPLLLGPLRPEVGFSPEEYSIVTFEALVGGADIIKDDELLCSPKYCNIRERANLCSKAARLAEDKTGKKKMYFLNISSDLSMLVDYINIGEKYGVDGFMIHPKITPSLISFAMRHTELPLISHYASLPTFANARESGIRFSLMSKIYRLCGSDFVTFPRPNPRFNIALNDFRESLQECLNIETPVSTSFPMPTGGNSDNSASECKEIINSNDYVFVSGSALFEDKNGIRAGAEKLLNSLESL